MHRPKNMVTRREPWVIWFRCFYGFGYALAIAIAVTHLREFREPRNIIALGFFLAVVAVFSIAIEWTFRVFKFVRIETDFDTLIVVENRRVRAQLAFDDFWARLVPVQGGYSIAGLEDRVFISRRHSALLRLRKRRAAKVGHTEARR